MFFWGVSHIGLVAGGFRSWLGDAAGSTKWMASRWGDVYLHETVISHIRRLLDTDFAATCFPESFAQFRLRTWKVVAHMNSPAFSPNGGRGLVGLAKSLHDRCAEIVERDGERIPH